MTYKQLEELTERSTRIEKDGFAIDIEKEQDTWVNCLRELGRKEAYRHMAEYLCRRYREIQGREFLFTEACMAHEIAYHADAFFHVNGKKDFPRPFTTRILSAQKVYDHCKEINISELDIHNFVQAHLFGYRKGTRACYKNR